MNFLHYLYVKANTHRYMGRYPRVNIAWPLWLVAILYILPTVIPSTVNIRSYYTYILAGSLFIIIYLFILAIYPPKLVKKNYDDWQKKYNDTTSLWFWLYFYSFIIFLVMRVYLWLY